MAKRKDSIEYKVLAFLKEIGATVDEIDHKKHQKIKWTYRGVKDIITLSQTTSDFRAEKNALSYIKRKKREIDNAKD